jgi:peptidoglycan hydrolase-like protein with peptidoglycan-binding domain
VRPIREGDRGPAVEDVQRRLRVLGADLGPTGVDGVFLGATLAAVRDFQSVHSLVEDGTVGPETWAALVDATFSLGDRLLYLRLPHLHGADVRILQGALNALGFASGGPDGIFGVFAERAVREFQLNTGLPSDGIVGPETVRALENLRHVWADKGARAPAELHRAPVRNEGTLAGATVALLPTGDSARLVAARLENLASAGTPLARFVLLDADVPPPDRGILVRIGEEAPDPTAAGPMIAAGEGGDALARRVEAALRSGLAPPDAVDVVLSSGSDDEQTLQRVAVGLLDGLCLGLAPTLRTVVP